MRCVGFSGNRRGRGWGVGGSDLGEADGRGKGKGRAPGPYGSTARSRSQSLSLAWFRDRDDDAAADTPIIGNRDDGGRDAWRDDAGRDGGALGTANGAPTRGKGLGCPSAPVAVAEDGCCWLDRRRGRIWSNLHGARCETGRAEG